MQPEFSFDHERSSMVFTPEYIEPEVQVTPYLINKNVTTTFTKKGFFAKFLSLPKMSSFTIDALEKTNLYVHDVHSMAKRNQTSMSDLRSKVEKFETRLAKIEAEDIQVKVRPLIDQKLKSVEDAGQNLIRGEVYQLKKELGDLRKKDALLMALAGASLVANLIIGYFWYSSMTGKSF